MALHQQAGWRYPARDEWGVLANRVPVQLMGAIFTLVIIWVLDWAGKRISIPGLVSTIGLFGLSAVLFSLSFLRADPTPVWKSLRLEAWGAVILMITSLIILTAVILRWKFSKKDESQV